MPNTDPFEIWQRDGAVLIRFANGTSVDLPRAVALSLATDLVAKLEVASARKICWTAQEDDEFRRLYAENLTARKIAARLGRSFSATQARLTKLGIANRRPDQSARLRLIGPGRSENQKPAA
jgi:hypothetical protein